MEEFRTPSGRSRKADLLSRLKRMRVFRCDAGRALTDGLVTMDKGFQARAFTTLPRLDLRLLQRAEIHIGGDSSRPFPATKRRADDLRRMTVTAGRGRGRKCLAVLACAGILAWCSLQAQLVPGAKVRGFRIPGYDAQNRTNSLLSGAEAIPQPNGQILIKELRVETYHPDGRVDFIVEAPDCAYDLSRRVASSAGPLSARTADGRFAITGEGFRWQQTNSNLIISNSVHTVLRPPRSHSLSLTP
jgi:hypothetical protein